jgi:hypothetical protein
LLRVKKAARAEDEQSGNAQGQPGDEEKGDFSGIGFLAHKSIGEVPNSNIQGGEGDKLFQVWPLVFMALGAAWKLHRE